MSQQEPSPGMLEEEARASKPGVGAHTQWSAQRIARAIRDQVELVPQSLEDRVGEDHPARAIWALLDRMDLSGFYAGIRAAVDGPGRPATGRGGWRG